MTGPTPYDVIAADVAPRRVGKPEVLRVCASLERRATSDPARTALVAVQDVRFAVDRLRRVWRQWATAGTRVVVYGRDVPAHLAPGVVGVALDDADPLVDVWALLLEWPDGGAAGLAGADVAGLGSATDVDDDSRDFDLVVTEDNAVVRRCLEAFGH